MTVAELRIDLRRLADCCDRFGVQRLETFGSFAAGDAGEASDLDVLVTFRRGVNPGLEFIALQRELEGIVGRRVDLLTRSSVERSRNKYFRRFALERTEPLYEA